MFASRHALGGHRSFLSPTCTPILASGNGNNNDNAVGDAVGNANGQDHPVGNAVDNDNDNAVGDAVGNGDAVDNTVDNDNDNATPTMSTTQLLQRPRFEYANHRVTPLVTAPSSRRCNTTNTFKLHEVTMIAHI